MRQGVIRFIAAAAVVTAAADASPCASSSMHDRYVAAPRPPTQDEIIADLPYSTVEQAVVFYDAANRRETIVLETRFDRASKAFSFIVPVPSKPEVEKLDKPPFESLRGIYSFTQQSSLGLIGRGIGLRGGMGAGQGGGGGSDAPPPPPAVEVLEESRVGSFTSFVLALHDVSGARAFFDEKQIVVPKITEEWLETYARLGFALVVFRYDPPDGGSRGMTSETVRLTFTTPVAYFPYSEPVRSPAPKRLLAAWVVSTEPVRPVARSSAGFAQPWLQGTRYTMTTDEAKRIFASVADLMPRADKLVVQTFRDWKIARDGWGDVVLVPEKAQPADAEREAEYPRIVGLLDAKLLALAPSPSASASASAPASASASASASAPASGSASAPEPAPARASSCSASTPGAPVSLVPALAIVAALLARRSRRLALVLLGACKAAPAPAPAVDAAATQPDAQVAAVAGDAAPVAEPVDAGPPDPELEGRYKTAVAVLRGEMPDGGVRVLAGSPPEPPAPSLPASNLATNVGIGTVVMTPSRPGGVEAIRRVVNTLRPRLNACYTHALDQNPSESGRLMLRCHVLRNGQVDDVQIATSAVSGALANCAQRVLRTAQLPEADADSIVGLPIVFQSQPR